MSAPSRVRGFTLLELLVSMAVTGVIMAGLLTVLDAVLRASAAGMGRVEAQQAARWALDRMTRELAEAGFDPRRSGLAAIEIAEPHRVRFVRDLDGDGAVDPTRERVTYLWDDVARILRREAGGGAQPIIDHVEDLAITYLDGDGAPTTDPAHVRTVRVLLEVGPGSPRLLIKTEVTLRNL